MAESSTNGRRAFAPSAKRPRITSSEDDSDELIPGCLGRSRQQQIAKAQAVSQNRSMDSVFAELSRLKDRLAVLERHNEASASKRPVQNSAEDSNTKAKARAGKEVNTLYDSSPPRRVQKRDMTQVVKGYDFNFGGTSPADDGLNHTIISTFEQDASLPPLVDFTTKLYEGMQMPAVIGRLDRVNLVLPINPNEDFSYKVLKKLLGGSLIGKGRYIISPSNKSRSRSPRTFPDLKAYTIMSREVEPLLPRHPGDHGAQISAFMQHGDNDDCPLFIRSGQGGYKYYGTYREPCPSDYIAHNEMIVMPDHVKRYWARRLSANPVNGKSQMDLVALKEIWPRIPVGKWDELRGKIVTLTEELVKEDGQFELSLKRVINEDEAEMITEEAIMEAFGRADMDEPYGVRLFYEYLECVGYDVSFYDKLVAARDELEGI